MFEADEDWWSIPVECIARVVLFVETSRWFLRPRNSLFRRIRLTFSLQKQKHESLVWDTRARKSPSLWHACDLPITFDGLISRSNRRWTFSGRRPATRLLRSACFLLLSRSPRLALFLIILHGASVVIVTRSRVLGPLAAVEPVHPFKSSFKVLRSIQEFSDEGGRRSKGSGRFVAIFIFALLRAHAAFLSRLDFYL